MTRDVKIYTKIEPLEPCWKGGKREWYVDGKAARDDSGAEFAKSARKARGIVGTFYQNQCFCQTYDVFINPSGHTCNLCKAGLWPIGDTKPGECEPCKARMIADMKAMNGGTT